MAKKSVVIKIFFVIEMKRDPLPPAIFPCCRQPLPSHPNVALNFCGGGIGKGGGGSRGGGGGGGIGGGSGKGGGKGGGGGGLRVMAVAVAVALAVAVHRQWQ